MKGGGVSPHCALRPRWHASARRPRASSACAAYCAMRGIGQRRPAPAAMIANSSAAPILPSASKRLRAAAAARRAGPRRPRTTRAAPALARPAIHTRPASDRTSRQKRRIAVAPEIRRQRALARVIALTVQALSSRNCSVSIGAALRRRAVSGRAAPTGPARKERFAWCHSLNASGSDADFVRRAPARRPGA